jgi:hypothetical protein
VRNGTQPAQAVDQANVRFGSKADIPITLTMSALPPKADMCGATRDVRYGPIADIRCSREAEVRRDLLLAKLEKAFAVAEKAKNGSAMTMSVIGMARICGLIIDRREVGEAGAFSGHTDEELIAEAAQRARRLGLAGPELVVANGPGNVANIGSDLANKDPEAG